MNERSAPGERSLLERRWRRFRRRAACLAGAIAPALAPAMVLAAEKPSPESIAVDTVWVVVAAVLVFFMQAGFAFLELGFSRMKNVGSVAAKIITNLSVTSLMFWATGFAIAFGAGNAIIGTTGWFLTLGSQEESVAFASLAYSNVPIGAKYLFEVVFAAVSLAIVWGALLERTKFVVYLVFGAVFAGFIYPTVGHWIWGGGWLAGLGMLDFAGSTVVHLQGGAAALAGALLLGARIGKFNPDGTSNPIPGHNIPLAVIGVLILWFGWFGFNPGSTLAAMGTHFAHVALTTNLAAAAGVLGALWAASRVVGNLDVGMAGNGAVAALVAITAPCAFVEPWAAVIIGAVAGTLMVYFVVLVDRLKIDDPVGAVSCHLMAGIWGTLSAGLFASPRLVELVGVGKAGLVYTGSFEQLGVQALGVAAAFAFVFLASLAVFGALKATVGIRVSEREELEGLDISEHGIWGYPEHFAPVIGGYRGQLPEEALAGSGLGLRAQPRPETGS